MNNTPTLEEFIKTYVSNKEKTSSAEGYADWVKSYGIDSKNIYDSSIRDITADYERAKSGYGANAEALASLGLNGGGYSDYLAGKAYSGMQKRKSGARDKYTENERSNLSGYLSYVEGMRKESEEAEKEASKKYSAIVDTIANAGITDYDKAYEYAQKAGLSDEDADSAARSANSIAYSKVFSDAFLTVIEKSFDEGQAEEYALAMGLTPEDAARISYYADRINKNYYYSSDYLKYLENKANSKK